MTHIKLQILKLINNFVLNAWLIIYFLELHHTCDIYIFERVTQLAQPPISTSVPVKSFIHVSVGTDHSVQLQDRLYRFHLSFDSFNDI
jgi:hypothetical protein